MTAKVCLLGFTVPDAVRDEIMRTDRHLPAQTHNFAWALVSSLRAGGLEVRLLSAWPVTNFPGNPRVMFRTGPFVERGVSGFMLGFVNLVGLKHLTRFLTCLRRGTQIMRRWRPSVLFVHGVHSPFLWYAAISRRLLGTTTVAVLTDPPGVSLTTDRWWTHKLRSIDTALVVAALRRMDAVIALTADLARDFAPGKPALVMDGISTSVGPIRRTRQGGDRVTILYAGSLRATYGVDRLIEAVSGLNHSEVTLEIYGSGELADSIRNVASQRPQIREPQLLSRRDLLAAYRSADLLVQPRPTNQGFVQYSFPSKLIEYMTSGTPVLTTRVAGVSDEYSPYVYWIDEDSSEGIERALRAVLELPEEERLNKARRAAEFIESTRSSVAQGNKIRTFIEDIQKSAAVEDPPEGLPCFLDQPSRRSSVEGE